MVSFRRILCPVDFSETSRHAFAYALMLTRQCDAELTVIHAVEDVPLFTAYAGVPELNLAEEAERSAQREMAELVANAGAPPVRLRTAILRGRTFKAILDFAEEYQADLIVMGTHGRTGLDYAFFGSVAERVIRRARCPVLIVRHPDAAKES